MTDPWKPQEETPLLGMKPALGDETIEGRVGGWIETFSGQRWWPYDPRTEDVHQDDFDALAQVIRFGAACRLSDGRLALYTVAQHSVLVADLVRAMGGSFDEIRAALVHDLHEIYPPGDVPSPVLRFDCEASRAIRALETGAKVVLRQALGMPVVLPEIVHRADVVLLATERRDLMVKRPWQRTLPVPLRAPIDVWSPETARECFLAELRKYDVRVGG